MSTATPSGWLRPVNGSTVWVVEPAASFTTRLLLRVGDVEVAGGVHRHTLGAVEAGERQHDLGARAGRQLQHPIVARVGDVEVAGGVHRHTGGGGEAGERQRDLRTVCGLRGLCLGWGRVRGQVLPARGSQDHYDRGDYASLTWRRWSCHHRGGGVR